MRRSTLLAFAISVALLIAAVGAVTSSAEESGPIYEEVPATVEPAAWRPQLHPRQPGERGDFAKGRTFSLEITGEGCVGEPMESVDHLRLVERPKTRARPYKSAVITAYMLHPGHRRIANPGEFHGPIYGICAGIGLVFRKRIKLKRPASELIFYDGSSSPPRRVWPPAP